MAWGNSDAAWRQADTSTLGGKASNAGQAANTMFGSWIAPAANRQLREDAMALSEGTLGMTEAQKGSLASKEQALAGAQVAKQQEDINRKALASGGGFAGQYAEATQALGGRPPRREPGRMPGQTRFPSSSQRPDELRSSGEWNASKTAIEKT